MANFVHDGDCEIKGWQQGVPDHEYHGNQLFVSSSQLRKIVRSPAAFRAALTAPPKDSDAMRFGRLCHDVLLLGEKQLEKYVIMPDLSAYGHYNSNNYKAAKAEWMQANATNTIVTRSELEKMKGVIESVNNHPDAVLLLKNGTPEISGYYVDSETNIRCRIRPDFINEKTHSIIDFKTTVDCSPREFVRSVWQYRYDFQLAMYGAGYEAINGRAPEYYVFIAAEQTPPYECAVYVCDTQMIATGRAHYHVALAKLRRAIDTDEWPQAQLSAQTLSLPAWANGVDYE